MEVKRTIYVRVWGVGSIPLCTVYCKQCTIIYDKITN